ncbi:MAG: DUF6537 domain-containing protein, partial [Pseudomonadota bacterium]
KRGAFPDPDRRIFINTDVCEGCGDCGVQSNCVSIVPVETELGRKRAVDQSSCNKDFSCVKGFCPSFAWVEGATLKKGAGVAVDIDALAAALPDPARPVLTATHNVLITGIGGFGVTTLGAVLAMAGHIEGIAASTLDMTGLAQKNGPVTSHVRFAPIGHQIEGPRVPAGALDTLIASDMLVACNAESLAMLSPERTLGVVNTKVQPTAEFVMKRTQSFDEARMGATLREGTRTIEAKDVAMIAAKLFGDQIFMNMILVGMAYQHGGLPVSAQAILQAIALNGAAVEMNTAAFKAGRVLAANPQAITAALAPPEPAREMDLDARIAFLTAELTAYQDARYAARFTDAIAALHSADLREGKGEALTRIAAESLFKAMAYKDEYEVARLTGDKAYWDRLRTEFDNPKAVRLMLAPPLLSRIDPATGRPKKRAFGPWVFPVLRALARLKGLRGTRFDPFGWTDERIKERALIATVLEDIALAASKVGAVPYGTLCDLLGVTARIKGFGPVKEANRAEALAERDRLLARVSRRARPLIVQRRRPQSGSEHREPTPTSIGSIPA